MNTTTDPTVSTTTDPSNRAGPSSLAGPALVFLGLALVAVAIVVEPRLNPPKDPTGRYLFSTGGMMDTTTGAFFKPEVKGGSVEWELAILPPFWRQ